MPNSNFIDARNFTFLLFPHPLHPDEGGDSRVMELATSKANLPKVSRRSRRATKAMTTQQEIIDYCLTLPASYEDYPFDEVVDETACTVMRHQQNKKSFALIMRHGGELYLNLKCEPLEADFLRSVYKSVIPGYHMNKTHWNTVIMGGDVPEDDIKRMIDRSYDLIKPKARRKRDV